MKRTPIVAFLAAALAATAAFGAGDPPAPDPKEPKSLVEARAAIARQEWTAAERLLQATLSRDPRLAEAHNLYAYAIRKGPAPRMDLVFRHYNEALRLRPDHRGAHEYLGEAYLMTGNIAKAREHLAVLESLCQAGCEERTELSRQISLFERQYVAR